MILTPHILVGAVIGSQVSSPVAVFVLSFLSHYFLEIFPHWEYELEDTPIKNRGFLFNKKVAIILLKILLDFLFGTALVFYLLWGKPQFSMSFVGLLAAVLPDGLLFLYWQSPQNSFLKFFARPHRALHFFKKRSPVWLGLTLEITITFFMVFLLASLA